MSRLVAVPTGSRFGWLTVLERAGADSGGRALYRCRCDCGSESLHQSWNLRNGQAKSCGCFLRDVMARVGAANATHGFAKRGQVLPEYSVWVAMIQRCENPKCRSFKDYGDRGIGVCAHWRKSFENFIADMGMRPTPSHSIDRFPDKDGNYEPGNCRWATRAQQQRNLRRTVMLEFDGRARALTDWAEELQISPRALAQRIRAGWPVERALTAPVSPRKAHSLWNKSANEQVPEAR